MRLTSTIAFNIFVEVLLMFLDDLNSTLWYDIRFILFNSCFGFFFCLFFFGFFFCNVNCSLLLFRKKH